MTNNEVLINVSEDITLITFNNAPASSEFISFVFELITKNNINVDMISQTAPTGNLTKFSFTIDDENLNKTLDICNQVKEKYPTINSLASSTNAKITIFTKKMTDEIGFALKIFSALNNVKIDPLIITTSEVDISVLVAQNSALSAKQEIEKILIKKS